MKVDEKALNYESSFGDVSSIMIMPDQMYNNFNLLEDEGDNNDQQNNNKGTGNPSTQSSSNGKIQAKSK
jgi:hypothetical protein